MAEVEAAELPDDEHGSPTGGRLFREVSRDSPSGLATLLGEAFLGEATPGARGKLGVRGRPARTRTLRSKGFVPLLGEEVELDEDDAAVVIVLPSDTGVIDEPDRHLPGASRQARRIFHREAEAYPDGLAGLRCLEDEDVTVQRYHEVVRAYLKELLEKGGFHATVSESIDRDELFLKVSARGDRLADLAQHYRYRMPFKASAHQRFTKGGHPGPLENADGVPVPAHGHFQKAMADRMEPFRHVDEIRLVLHALLSRANLPEMRKQGVIRGYFPAASYQEVLVLNKEWAHMSRAAHLDTPQDLNRVRDYFGEHLAFLFAWFASYNRALAVLALPAALTQIRTIAEVGEDARNWLRNGFAVFLVMWMAAFNEQFKRRVARFKQLWGTDNFDSEQAYTRQHYDAQLEGTRRATLFKVIVRVCVVLYVASFAGVVLGLSMWGQEMRERGKVSRAAWVPYVVSVLIKCCAALWGNLAFRLVRLENHRTDARFNDALAWMLATVKLFVALFPFASIAFLEPEFNETCASSLQDAAFQVYGGTGWPPGTALRERGAATSRGTADLTLHGDLDFLAGHWRPGRKGKTCILGCYPSECWREGEKLVCHTNCSNSLATQLVAYFFVHLGSAAFHLIMPIVITKARIRLEMARASGEAPSVGSRLRSVLGLGLAEPSRDPFGVGYSFIQCQAKCHRHTPYRHGSWGGCYVEDFLELAVGYALLACFGILVPGMAVIGWLSQMVMYRILAYRMLNVTGRPWPDGAEGIGTWQPILSTVRTLAVTCNVAMATFVMSPIKDWELSSKLVFFVLAQNLLFGLQAAVDFVVPDKPADVVRIEDFNAAVAAALSTGQRLAWDSADKTCDYEKVQVSFRDCVGSEA